MDPRAGTVKPTTPVGEAKLVANLKGHPGGVRALAFSSDRSLLAVGGGDGGGGLWEIGGVPRERARFGGGARFHSLAFAPNGKTLAAGSGFVDGLIKLFDLSEKSPSEIGVLRGARGPVDAVAVSPDGKLVAGSGEDRTLHVWEPGPGSRGDARSQLTGHTAPVRALAFAPDSQGAATAAQDSTARLWTLGRIRSWQRAVLPHPDEVHSVAWSADGKTVATACRDGIIRLWDPAAMKTTPRAELVGAAGALCLVAFTSPDGMLVVVSEGPRVANWDPRTGQLLREWEVPGGPVTAAALTADGRYLAAGKADGTVGIYRVAEKRA